MLKSAFRRVLNRHITQAHGPKINKAFSLCGRRPHREAACALLNKKGEEETLQRCQILLLRQYPSNQCQQEGREEIIGRIPLQIPGTLILNKTCVSAREPAARHLPEICDFWKWNWWEISWFNTLYGSGGCALSTSHYLLFVFRSRPSI